MKQLPPSILEHFHQLKKKSCIIFSYHLPFSQAPCCPTPGTTNCVYMNLLILNHSFSMERTVSGFWYLASFTLHNVLRVQPCFSVDQHIFLFYGWKIFYCRNITYSVYLFISSVQFNHSVVSDSLRPHESQHARPPYPFHLLEFTQTQVHRVGDAIQPSHPLSSLFLPAPNPSQHQSLFQWVNSSHEVAKVLEFQL